MIKYEEEKQPGDYQWFDVKTHLPDNGRTVLIYLNSDAQYQRCMGYYFHGDGLWYIYDKYPINVTNVLFWAEYPDCNS